MFQKYKLKKKRCQYEIIYNSKQKYQELHTSERTIVPRTVIFSSEGALYVILPYDYPAAPTF